MKIRPAIRIIQILEYMAKFAQRTRQLVLVVFLVASLATIGLIGGVPTIVWATAACAANAGDPSPTAYSYPGRVVAFVAAAQIESRTHAVELKTGWLLSESYAHWPRVIVDVDEGNGYILNTMAAHSNLAKLKVGDPVVAISRHRDPAHPCHFIPWTVKEVTATS